MKKILITQRLISNQSYYEIREALDTNYSKLLSKSGFLPIALPYEINFIDYFNEFNISGILLTGGNDLNSFSSNTTFYRSNIFRVATGNTGQFSSFDNFIVGVRAGSGSYSGTNGLSDKQTFVGYTDDVVPNNDQNVTTGYYKNLIKTAMENLGYSFS